MRSSVIERLGAVGLVVASLVSCATTAADRGLPDPAPPVAARLADRPADYSALGLKPDVVAPWEDGLRTDGGAGTFEWWYYDAQLEDGSTLVVVFFSKHFAEARRNGFRPLVSVRLDRADGTVRSVTFRGRAGDARFGGDRTDVQIGVNRFHGDLDDYHIHVAADGLVIDASLRRTARPIRPATGYVLFDDPAADGAGRDAGERAYFAWLNAVPRGQTEVHITEGGKTTTLRGVGYHDHNWGNRPLDQLLSHWYWGRGNLGGRTVVAARMVTAPRFGGTVIPLLAVSSPERVDNRAGQAQVGATVHDLQRHRVTGVPVAGQVVYETVIDGRNHVVTWRRVEELVAVRSGLLARLVLDVSYHRFAGPMTLDLAADADRGERFEADGIWELMYFGNGRRR